MTDYTALRQAALAHQELGIAMRDVSPQDILRLLDERDRLEAALREVVAWVERMEFEHDMHSLYNPVLQRARAALEPKR